MTKRSEEAAFDYTARRVTEHLTAHELDRLTLAIGTDLGTEPPERLPVPEAEHHAAAAWCFRAFSRNLTHTRDSFARSDSARLRTMWHRIARKHGRRVALDLRRMWSDGMVGSPGFYSIFAEVTA